MFNHSGAAREASHLCRHRSSNPCSPALRMIPSPALARLKAFPSLWSFCRGSSRAFMVGSTAGVQASPSRAEVDTGPASKRLEDLSFDNTFIRELPGDPEQKSFVRQVFKSLYSRVSPTPANGEPYTVAYSADAAQLLELSPAECERPEFALLMAGAAPLPGAEPYAQCYGGHQFGSWAGQLGDGRAITLGEVITNSGQRWELQLKGAGKTPYSRFADGRAVMRSSIREFVASEALHHLGVPTTRALCVVGTGDQVVRDMFYTGDARKEPGAVVCRVAPSFVRFGTFQLPASRGPEEQPMVAIVADYVIRHHYPHLEGEPNKYLALLQEVIQRTAMLVAMWQTVGFVHGVLNTDNMSILGLTLDYGPFGFLDKFDPYFTPNISDFDGLRYAYRSQPDIGQYNLVQLANSLLLVGLVDKAAAEEALTHYSRVLTETYNVRMAQKLGLPAYDRDISVELMKNMYQDEVDFTNTFRALSSVSMEQSEAYTSGGDVPGPLRTAIKYDQLSGDRQAAWSQWLISYKDRIRRGGVSDAERRRTQDAANPKFIARQHLLHNAIQDAERGDFTEVNALMHVLTRPYDEQPEADPKYTSPPPAEMVRPGVCTLSCSS